MSYDSHVRRYVVDRIARGLVFMPDGCWLFRPHCSTPRPNMYYQGESQLVYRVTWQLFRGPIPDGMVVCHKCDVPRCVNPDHLFVGTIRDNSIDMIQKGRGWQPHPRNEDNPNAYVSDAFVLAVRLRAQDTGEGAKTLSKQLGIPLATVKCWLTGRNRPDAGGPLRHGHWRAAA